MERMRVYPLLAEELERWRASPWMHVADHAGRPATCTTVMFQDEAIRIETRIAWIGGGHDRVRVTVTADGHSGWRLERLEESIVIAAPGEGKLSAPEAAGRVLPQ